jgi:Ca-activated chloride channel family protein
MLFLIWAVPLLFVVYIHGSRKRRRILKGFASVRGLSAIAPQTGSRRRRIKAALILGALFFMAIALCGPQYGYKWKEIERKGVDIVIAVDCSRSMLATDIRPTRLDRAKREVFDLLGMLKGDRIGLVAFAGTAFLQCPLTLDYEAFSLFMNVLSPDFLPVGGTDIPGAVLTSDYRW